MRVLEGEHAQGGLLLALIGVPWLAGVDVLFGEAPLAELEADLAHGIAALRVEKGELARACFGIVEVAALLEARDGTFDLFVTVALAREFLIKLCFAVLLAREDVDGSYEGRLHRFCRCCGSLPLRYALCSSRAIAAGAAARGEISGDAVQQFCSAAAAQMILCDGMGTGRPAAVDGNLAAELTARLLKAGFTAELAARLVNVALALKSDEESGATLDLVSVDLYTGTARLFKAGAAPGFLVHGGKARAVGEASLPMGILGGVSGQSRVVHLAAGDYVVLVSDGLLVDGPGWVMQQLELSAAKAEQPEVLAKKLVEAARARAVQRGRPDDITAAVLRLENS